MRGHQWEATANKIHRSQTKGEEQWIDNARAVVVFVKGLGANEKMSGHSVNGLG
jgi:hypothetical protein